MGALILFEDNICFLGKGQEHDIIFAGLQVCKTCKTSGFIFSPLSRLVNSLIGNGDFPMCTWRSVGECTGIFCTIKCKTSKLSDSYALELVQGVEVKVKK